jgi:hypothetical protein
VALTPNELAGLTARLLDNPACTTDDIEHIIAREARRAIITGLIGCGCLLGD